MVAVLKVLFAAGVVRVGSGWLDGWALRQWRWRKRVDGKGVWDFEGRAGGSGEVVVVTGGCGGIGMEVVRGLVGRGGAGVKVVVVDVVGLPGEFEGRKCGFSSSSFFVFSFFFWGG